MGAVKRWLSLALTTQAVGVLVIAAMSVIGLASVQNIAKQEAVVKRMVHYQAEEIALDAEMMHDWDYGYVEKDLEFRYDVKVNSTNIAGWDYMITLSRFGTTAYSLVNVRSGMTIPSTSFTNSTICMRKQVDTLNIEKGEC